MLDGFALSHRQIALNGNPRILGDELMGLKVFAACTRPFAPMPLDVFARSRLARVQVLHLEAFLEEATHSFEPMQDHERRLIEAVILHRMGHGFRRSNDGMKVRYKTVVGAMEQDRLTLLLLDLHPNEARRVVGIAKMPHIYEAQWRREFFGAAATVRTIKSLCRLNAIHVVLPTIHEDVDLGVDLFALNGVSRLAISVKSTAMVQHTTAEIVMDRYLRRTDTKAFDAHDRQRIFDGARTVSVRYQRPFTPARVMVARSSTVLTATSPSDADLTVVKHIVTSLSQ
ncbi:hypothetical protein HZA85_00315 [Candidatus Uhrbacteria bacterium]|nr:hypothetical protein [Candidatus Uhrbacteria bacterium]